MKPDTQIVTTNKSPFPEQKTSSGGNNTFLSAAILEKNRILPCLLVGLTFSMVMALALPPSYRAEALIRFQGTGQNLLERKIQTEQAFLESSGFTRKAATSLAPLDDKRSPSTEAESINGFKRLNLLTSKSAPTPVKEDNIRAAEENFRKNFQASKISGSDILALHYTDLTPQAAVEAVNAIARFYVHLYQEEIASPPPETSFTKSLLQRKMEQTETDLTNFINEHNKKIEQSLDLSSIDAQITTLKLKRDELRTTLGSESRGSYIPALSQSAEIQSLKKDVEKLEGEMASLSKRYGDKHPRITTTKALLSVKYQKLAKQSDAIILPLVDSLKSINTQIEALEQRKTEAATNQHIDETYEIEKAKLERDYADARSAHDLYVKTIPSKAPTALDPTPSVVLASTATEAVRKYKTSDLFIILSPTALSFLVSLFIVLANKRRIRSRYYSRMDIEADLMHPCAAMIPDVEDFGKTQKADFVLEHPSSALTESIRSLRMHLKKNIRESGSKNCVLSLSSALPAEGKTMLACWLARLSAKSGEKVLLIDCDLRRPSIQKLLQADDTHTLTDYLSGKSTLDQVVNKDRATGLDYIAGRSTPNSAADLLCSEKMIALIASLRQNYDLIIIDTPASLSVSDSKAITGLCDQILYVIGWGKTPRQVVHNGIHQINSGDLKKISFILNRIDVPTHARMGYGDTFCYYGEYKPLASAA